MGMTPSFKKNALMFMGVASLALFGSCSTQKHASQPVPAKNVEHVRTTKDLLPRRVVLDTPANSERKKAGVVALPSAAAGLSASLQKIGEKFDGDVGIAVSDIQTGWTSHFGGTSLYPQQSVSKLWVALTALDLSDRGELDLSERITLGPGDLAVFHQPIRELALQPGGYSTTLGDLLFRAITRSDNMANDVLLWRSGGPEAVRAFLHRKGITNVRFGPGERLLQSGIAGLEWKPDYSLGRRFYAARADVPTETRRASFEAYVADPVDGAAPVGVVDALARLSKGEILSASATDRVLSIMRQTQTGRLRLKAGLPAGWKLGHKTGTGQIFGGEQAGYNDIGIMTSPAGRSYAIAVFIGRTSEPVQARTALMHKSVRAVVSYERDLMRQQRRSAKSGSEGASDERGFATAKVPSRGPEQGYSAREG